MNFFYCPNAVLNEYCALDETESNHVARVLRKKEGEELFVFDGNGNLYDSRITAIGKKEVTTHIVRLMEKDAEDKPRLHLAIAPPKNMERLEWMAEKVTEIGVAEITPLICRHSERRELRNDRLFKVLLAACKQSLRLTLPRLNPMVPYERFVTTLKGPGRRYIAYCDDRAIHLKNAYQGGFDATVLIGPEGDFAKEEVLFAQENEFEVVALGKSRLRLETAGIYATTLFNIANER